MRPVRALFLPAGSDRRVRIALSETSQPELILDQSEEAVVIIVGIPSSPRLSLPRVAVWPTPIGVTCRAALWDVEQVAR